MRLPAAPGVGLSKPDLARTLARSASGRAAMKPIDMKRSTMTCWGGPIMLVGQPGLNPNGQLVRKGFAPVAR